MKTTMAESTPITVIDSAMQDNRAVGGAGAVGGTARGGGLYNAERATATILATILVGNQAVGGVGTVTGGDGWGGGLFDERHATITLLGSTVTGNSALGGAGPTPGKGVGGGIHIVPDGAVNADGSARITRNYASTSDDDIFGILRLI